jgi:methionyl-tRNA formyltransferase
MIAPLRPDLIVTGAFNGIIPADVLALPRLGAINGHDALLPKYRGGRRRRPTRRGGSRRRGVGSTGRSLWDRDRPLGAGGTVEGAPIRVMKTALVAGEEWPSVAPGTVLRREGETLLIQCGDRPLQILRYRDDPPSPNRIAAPGARDTA